MNNEEKSEQSKSVEISFGTMFTPSSEHVDEPGRIDVITDIGEGDTFGSRTLHKDDKGTYLSILGGTGDSDDFGEKIGQMTPEEAIEGLNQGWIRAGVGELPQKVRDIAIKEAEKGSRILIIK